MSFFDETTVADATAPLIDLPSLKARAKSLVEEMDGIIKKAQTGKWKKSERVAFSTQGLKLNQELEQIALQIKEAKALSKPATTPPAEESASPVVGDASDAPKDASISATNADAPLVAEDADPFGGFVDPTVEATPTDAPPTSKDDAFDIKPDPDASKDDTFDGKPGSDQKPDPNPNPNAKALAAMAEIEAIKPGKQHHVPVIMRFISGAKVFCLGAIEREKNDEAISVVMTSKVRGDQEPFIGGEVCFPREKTLASYEDKKARVWFKFGCGKYEMEYHPATAKELTELLVDLPKSQHLKVNEAASQEKLIVISFHYQEYPVGIEFGSPGDCYSHSSPVIQKEYDDLHNVQTSATLSFYAREYAQLQGNLKWVLEMQPEWTAPLDHWLHNEAKGKAAYVQWGKIKEVPQDMRRFAPRRFFRKYADYNLIHGNAEALEALEQINIIKELRNTPVKMSVLKMKKDDDRNFVGFLQFKAFHDVKDVVMKSEAFSIVFNKAPVPKTQQELAPGEKPARDTEQGWYARNLSEKFLGSDNTTDIKILLQRPRADSDNPTKNRDMPAAAKKDDVLPFQMVFVKIRVDINTVRYRIKAFNELRWKESKGDDIAERKRRMLEARNLTCDSWVDLVPEKILEDPEVAELIRGLTETQRTLFTSYFHRLPDGIGLVQGPWGTGKTLVIFVLLVCMEKQGKRLLVSCASNTACDNVIDKLAVRMDDYVNVRLHSTGLERRTMLRETNKQHPLKPKDPKPISDEDQPEGEEQLTIDSTKTPSGKYTNAAGELVLLGEGEEDDDGTGQASKTAPNTTATENKNTATSTDDYAAGWHDDAEMKCDAAMLKAAEDHYTQLPKLKNPDDPRMKVKACSLYTWVLKWTGIVESKWNMRPSKQQLKTFVVDRWANFVTLYQKSKVQELNNAEWIEYKAEFVAVCRHILERADAVICTPAQLNTKIVQGIKWDAGVVDEGTTMCEADTLQVWRAVAVMIIIGDLLQSAVKVFGKKNPFGEQLAMSLFERWAKAGYPYHYLKETMRATKGLVTLSNHLFYDNNLISGPRTDLDHATRAMTVRWREHVKQKYPGLKDEPQGETYPVLINILGGRAEVETAGTSTFNLSFVAATIDVIKDAVEKGVAGYGDIGICTPYVAQVAIYFRTLKGMDSDWSKIRVGTIDHWQGKEVRFLVSDGVRAGNDQGNVGSMRDPKRINVWITRMQCVHVIVGDNTCTMPPQDDPRTAKKLNYANKHLIRLFDWLHQAGRVVDIHVANLPQSYIQFATTTGKTEDQETDDISATPAPVGSGGW